jgi:penicillin-binding protein 1A
VSTSFNPFSRRRITGMADPADPAGLVAPAGEAVPEAGRKQRWRWAGRGLLAGLLLFLLLVAYLAVTAPLSKSLLPPEPPSITLLSAEGTPIARRGAIIGDPVDAGALPPHVVSAFLAIEDRRFHSHWGIDPRGILRAALSNASAGGVRQGGSTITQQLAKNAFLDSDRTMTRKLREVVIAFWLEAWLSKDEILSRYLSNVYFGDNVYGLRAAAEHYFGRKPERLSIAQAAMLAGLVKAPSRLAPTRDLAGARARQKVVVAAMVDAGMLDAAQAARVRPARIIARDADPLPAGTYFADWVMPQARERAGEISKQLTVRTTLDMALQRIAERVTRSGVAGAGMDKAQIALVAMRPDGKVVAMVGGRDYRESSFNRATQAQRQAGSAFKLFVYLAALRAGFTPETMIEDTPVSIGDWEPRNNEGKYIGTITLRRAFQKSSNVAAARLIFKTGPQAVIKAARDLGVSSAIPEEATIALGTSTMSLLELTSAYAAIAAGEAPVRPVGLADPEKRGWFDSLRRDRRPLGRTELAGMRDLLASAVRAGTASDARLPITAYGKTGTTQRGRDVWFVGYADGLIAGIWVGNDDNSANYGITSHLPARIWRDFMAQALRLSLPEDVDTMDSDLANMMNAMGNDMFEEGIPEMPETDGDPTLELSVPGAVDLRIDRDSVSVTVPPAPPPPEP